MPLIAGLVLVASAAAVSRTYRPEMWLNLMALVAWACGVVVVLLSWESPQGAVRRARGVLSRPGLASHVTVLFVLALFLRTAWLANVPANLNGDAFSQALDAVAFLEGRQSHVFGTSVWYGVPLLYPWIGSLFLRVFGLDPWVWRLVTAVGAAAAVPLTYVLVRVQFGRPRPALVAATLLTFYHMHVYFSRIGSNQGFDATFAAALVLALVLAHRRPSAGLWWYAAGAVAGLGFYFYFALRGLAALAFCAVVVLAFLGRAPRLRAPLWYLVGLAMAAAPLAAKPAGYGTAHSFRLREVLDTPGSAGGSVVSALADRLIIVLQTVYGTTLRGWYHSDAGVLVSPLELFLFVLGTIVALWLLRRAGWIHPFVLLGMLVAAAVLVENPIMAQRVTAISVSVCVIMALGIDWLSRLTPSRTRGVVAVLLVLAVIALNADHVFLKHMPRRDTDGTSLRATELSRWLLSEPQVERIEVCGGDQMKWDSHSAVRYQLPLLRGRDIGDASRAGTGAVESDTAYVILPLCQDLLDRLGQNPELRGEELRYRAHDADKALQLYADTDGLGYLRWVPADASVPREPGEEVVMTIFLAREQG